MAVVLLQFPDKMWTRVLFSAVGVLCLSAVSVISDYPPHDVSYRVHPIALYPREAAHSKFCSQRPDGIYPHHELGLGDPRCTFAACTNGRTIVQSCPGGTRTGFFYLPKGLRKYGGTKYGRGLEARFREEFRNPKSAHGVCDYLDVSGVCGSLYPDHGVFVHERDVTG